jgi:hypothetical protein
MKSAANCPPCAAKPVFDGAARTGARPERAGVPFDLGRLERLFR